MKILYKTVVILLISLNIPLAAALAKTGTMPAGRIVAVDVYKVSRPSNVPVMLEYPARLKSTQKVQIAARVTGILIKKFYTEGKFVRKGDLLYKIEPGSYKAAVDGARAQLQMAKARLNKAARDWNRIKAMYADNTASQLQRDASLSAYEIAKAGIINAEATLKIATINLNYTDVRATISGITGLESADVGSLVTNGTPLVRITKVNPIYAEFSIPDINIIREKYYIKSGRWEKAADGKIKAIIKINGKPYNKEGFVNFVDADIDPGTSTVKARAIFQNPSRYLMPGEFVRIILHGFFRKDAVMIPQKAVLQNPLGTMVFVVNKGKAQIRPVKLGETSGQYYIIESGLKEGNLVIVDNFFRVRPGAPVKIDKTINAKR